MPIILPAEIRFRIYCRGKKTRNSTKGRGRAAGFGKMPREQERTSVSLDIILEWSSGKREARVSDLSLGGCFIDCIAGLREGEMISFKILVPDGQWLAMEGKVVYALPGFGFGVRFTSLSESQRNVLEYLILMNNGNPWGGETRPREADPPFQRAQ